MKIITYFFGTRHEYSIAVTKLTPDFVLVTGMPKRHVGSSNGRPYHLSFVVHRDELVDTHSAAVELWDLCGSVGHRHNNTEVVPAICEVLGEPVPFIYIQPIR